LLLLAASCGESSSDTGTGADPNAGVTGGSASASGGSAGLTATGGSAGVESGAGAGGAEAGAGGDAGIPPQPPECADYVGRVTTLEAAHTPREDLVAELLALDHAAPDSGVAPWPEYERIAAELEALRAAHPDVTALFYEQRPNIIPFPEYESWAAIRLTFTEAGARQVAAGTYTAWDCPNALYRVTEIDQESDEIVTLVFEGYYKLPLILEDYATLPEVAEAQIPANVFWTSDACVDLGDEGSTYLFLNGLGDCPAGCTGREFWGFRVSDTTDVEYLGYVGEDDETPDWWTEAERCREFLW
jgi:hypothetical protein